MATLERKPKYCNSVLLAIWMLISIQLCTLLYNGSDPLTMCMFTNAAPGFHFALAGIHVTPHILDDANLPDGPGLFLGEQPLAGSQFNLPMIHSDFALPEVLPAPPPSGVLPD